MIFKNFKKSIIYVGETSDYSDRWLISELKKDFKVYLLSLEDGSVQNKIKSSIVVNRLYLSAAQRLGQEKVNILRHITNAAKEMINSNKGWELESDRIRQKEFFGQDYINTVQFSELKIIKETDFPMVIKKNGTGRNTKLLILRNLKDIEKCEETFILQPLIQQTRCFRTEFVGTWHATFDQYIKIEQRSLSFSKNHAKIIDPLPQSWYNLIRKKILLLNVRAFSIEYFVVDKKPIIIDFNMTSNYSKEFIVKNPSLYLAWKGLIDEKNI